MSRSAELRLMLVIVVAFSSVGSAAAQSSNATLHGTIADPSGAVLPGVAVSLESPSTGLKREAVTNEAGLYVFNFLPAGQYLVTAELSGFKAVRHENLPLEVGQNLALDMKLEVGQVQETVTVEGAVTLLDRTSAAISTVIQSAHLKELPLAGRHWAGLMLLAPGAINTGDGTHLSTRFAGRARDDNNWTFDGIDATGVKDPRQDSAARLIISSESIAEFRVGSALYSAESGAGAGGQVQLISKTGTNQFRGTVYNFMRNDAFDARPFGTTGALPPFRLNQYGMNVGGPITPQRTFFFVNFEGLRQRQTQSFTRFVPSQAFRASVDSAVAGVIAQYPSGTGPTSDPNIDEWRVQQQFTADEDAPSFRVDHRFSDATSLFGRYNYDNANITNPTDTGFTTNKLRPSNFVLQVQRILSASIVNELKFGYNASLRTELRSGPSDVQISVPGIVALTGPREILEDGRTFSVIDNLGIVRGRHNMKIGGEIRRIFVDIGEGNTTSLSYSSRPNLQANRLESFSIVDFPVVQGQRWWYFGYIQDDIKWRPNLTINAGLRYEYYSVVEEKDGRAKVWRMSCGGFCPQGTSWYQPDKNNFAPRVGFAWSPARFGDATVIRAGSRAERRRVRTDRQLGQPLHTGTRHGAGAVLSHHSFFAAGKLHRQQRPRGRREPRRSVRGALQPFHSAGLAVAVRHAGWLHRQPGAPHAGSLIRQPHRSGNGQASSGQFRACRHQVQRVEHQLQRSAGLAAASVQRWVARRHTVHVVTLLR